jgi:hypothetical protein
VREEGLDGRSLPPVAARTPRIIATIAIKGMMTPPRLVRFVGGRTAARCNGERSSGLRQNRRADHGNGEGRPFLKLILNSLLSCSVLALPQCYWVDNPKIGNGFDLARVLPDCTASH